MIMDALLYVYNGVMNFPSEVVASWTSWTMGEKVGFVAGGFSNMAYVPQFYKILKTRSAHDVSLLMYAFLITGSSIWLVYGVLTGQRPIVVNNIFTFTMRSLTLLIKIVMDGKTKKAKPSPLNTKTI